MDRKRILVVDDNEFFIQQEISCLGRDRFQFSTAGNGGEALEMARKLLPDLILLDQILPDLTGPEICGYLKNDPLTSSIPVVIVSSGSRESTRAGAQTALCDGLIYKPIRGDLLLTIVEALLDLGQLRPERAAMCLPCTISTYEGKTSAHLLSLSSEGAFVSMNPLPIRGDVFEIRFTLPVHEVAVYVRAAAVVWTGRLRETDPEGAGMRFLTIDPMQKESIKDYVSMILRTGKSESQSILASSFPPR